MKIAPGIIVLILALVLTSLARPCPDMLTGPEISRAIGQKLLQVMVHCVTNGTAVRQTARAPTSAIARP